MQPFLMIENGKLLKVKELPSVQLYLLKPNRVTLLLCTKGVFVKFFKFLNLLFSLQTIDFATEYS